jgi:hypothetical protein
MAGTSPEPSESQIVEPKKSKAKKKKEDKEKRKHSRVVKNASLHDGHENELTQENTSSTYQPPPGSVLFDNDVDFGEFDWDSVENDEDIELWLVRVPDSVRLVSSPFYYNVLHFC